MYRQVLDALEGTPEFEGELALFNKLGDLYAKTGNVQAAVEIYERAAEHYEKAGFPNNAIALCNKILRSAPGRTHVYLRLARLMLQRGFTAEAKGHLLEYAERMQRAGELDEAFSALREFADLSPHHEEIRLVLAEQLKAAARTDQAREQLATLYAELQTESGARRARSSLPRMKAIDPEFDPERAPKGTVEEKKGKTTELVFLDLGDEEAAAEPSQAAPVPAAPSAPPAADAREVEELPIERTSPEFAEVEEEAEVEGVGAVEGLVGTSFDAAGAEEEAPALEIEPTVLDDSLERLAGGAEAEALAETGEGEVPFIQEVELELVRSGAEATEEAKGAPLDVGMLETQVAARPQDPTLHRTLGEALLEAGSRERGLEELDRALDAAEARGDWEYAEAMAEEIVRLDPNSVRHHQKRVEYAYRRNDRSQLVRAYLGLAEALLRDGAIERSRAVYQRVLEHDPGNEDATAALATLEPEEEEAVAAAEPAGGFVNLAELVLGDEELAVADTRLRVEDEEPSGDEDRDFADMLAQFKRGIAASLEEGDWQSHYDLGVAFREMGLLDEAISEFQKALRSPEARLKTAEVLGLCFFEKGQYSVAATVLRRAIDADPAGDEEKIGLLYCLGRCEELQVRFGQALDHYRRVFAVDINFQDVKSRVESLAEAGR